MALKKYDFRLDPADVNALAQTGKARHGISNVSELVRMAIRQFLQKSPQNKS